MIDSLHTRDVGQILESQIELWEYQRRTGGGLPAGQEIHDFVAVSRQVGAGGSEVARIVGQRLGWPVFDKELLQHMAGHDPTRLRVYESMDERDTAWLEKLLYSLAPGPSRREDYFHRLLSTVLALARQGEAVFIGRGAGHILPAGVGLRVRVVAPEEWRRERLIRVYGIAPELAAAWIERAEAERAQFLWRHFHARPDDPTRHDLVVNGARWSSSEAAELVLAARRLRGAPAPAGPSSN